MIYGKSKMHGKVRVIMNLGDLLQSIVNMSTKDKMAVSSYAELLPILGEIDEESQGARLVFSILGATVGADGQITPAERQFCVGLFNAQGIDMTESALTNALRRYSGANWRDLVVELAGALSSKQKTNLVSLVAAICAIDDKISKEEVSFLVDLITA